MEKLAWLDAQSDRLVEAFSEGGNSKDMHMCIKGLLICANARLKDPKCLRVNDSKGVPTQSIEEEKQAFREHFAKLMGGMFVLFRP